MMRIFAAMVAGMCACSTSAWAAPAAQRGVADIHAAENIIKGRLFDPYSVRFEAALRRNGVDHAGTPTRLVCGSYNAKNRYGAYVGSRSFVYAASEQAVFTGAGERLNKDGSGQFLDQSTTPAGNDLETLSKNFTSDMDRIFALGDEIKFWLHQCE